MLERVEMLPRRPEAFQVARPQLPHSATRSNQTLTMCGIAGFNWRDEQLASKMASVLKHRGPDDSGCFTDRYVSLGLSRLSIVDTSDAGHQPMLYEHGGAKVVIAHNGEIYNYRELRVELEERGHRFSSGTDTEVILACYLEYGYECVNRFNGMWAFCIYDVGKTRLFCSRDRFGKKPFYYYHANDSFVFASELKALLAHDDLSLNTFENLNKEAIELYFTLGFVPSPFSIYTNTFKLEPGHNLVFDLASSRVSRKWRFYDLPEYDPLSDKAALIEEGRHLLADAVRLRLRSDVPVGALLSGGLDSSTITALMSDFVSKGSVHTFSIGFDGGFDETPYVNVAKDFLGTNHHHYRFQERDFWALLDTYSYVYDEPFYDYSGFPTYRVCEIASHDVTVLLSGDGGDEVFGGYRWHQVGAVLDRIKEPAHSPAEYRTAGMSYRPESFRSWFMEKLNHSLDRGAQAWGEAFRIYDLLFNTLPDDFLVKVDRASMANSVEVRSPFLDYRLVEFAQRVPTRWKAGSTGTKILMRELVDGLLPERIVKRGKQGFEPPLVHWIQDETCVRRARSCLHILRNIDEKLYAFYDQTVLTDKRGHARYLIRLFLFAAWFDRWVAK